MGYLTEKFTGFFRKNENGADEWRCRGCDSLLAIRRGGQIEIKYLNLNAWVEGSIYSLSIKCRKCNSLNRFENDEVLGNIDRL